MPPSPYTGPTLADHGFESAEELAAAVQALADELVEQMYGAEWRASWGGVEQGWLRVERDGDA